VVGQYPEAPGLYLPVWCSRKANPSALVAHISLHPCSHSINTRKDRTILFLRRTHPSSSARCIPYRVTTRHALLLYACLLHHAYTLCIYPASFPGRKPDRNSIWVYRAVVCLLWSFTSFLAYAVSCVPVPHSTPILPTVGHRVTVVLTASCSSHNGMLRFPPSLLDGSDNRSV
jgi:hypothetical protein